MRTAMKAETLVHRQEAVDGWLGRQGRWSILDVWSEQVGRLRHSLAASHAEQDFRTRGDVTTSVHFYRH